MFVSIIAEEDLRSSARASRCPRVASSRGCSRVVYLQAPSTTSLDSDIVLVVKSGNYALGHVTLDLKTGTGQVTIWGGTGQFTSFHARAGVSPLGDLNWSWDGKYRFGHYDKREMDEDA